MRDVLTKKARKSFVVIAVENLVMVLYLLNFPRESIVFLKKKLTIKITKPVTNERVYVVENFTQESQHKFCKFLYSVISENETLVQKQSVYKVD